MRVCVYVLVVTVAFLTGGREAFALPQLLVDMRSGEVLFEEDAGKTWHPASLAKLMTAYIVFEAVASGKVTLDTPVIVSSRALAAPPGKMGFPVGTAVTLKDALYMLIVRSANDLAIAIAETLAGSEEAFVALMNRRAAELGMTNSHFRNSNGLHDPSMITSARDMAILAMSIRGRYPQYDGVFETRTIEFGRSRLPSYNVLLTRFQGATGMKTGYVCASGLNIVATARREGRALMAIVMGASSARERAELTALLLERGFGNRYISVGKPVTGITNLADLPTDMHPRICGAEASAYRKSREAVFPFGLKGEMTYLGDLIAPRRVRVNTLGKLVDVNLPRSRPAYHLQPDPVAIAVPPPRPE